MEQLSEIALLAQFSEFMGNHVSLFVMLGVVVVMLAWNIFSAAVLGGKAVSTTEVTRLMNREDAVVIDVQSTSEFANMHILGAVSAPITDLKDEVDRLKAKYATRPVILCCKIGGESPKAGKILKKAGFEKIYRLKGGILDWQNEKLPVSSRKGDKKKPKTDKPKTEKPQLEAPKPAEAKSKKAKTRPAKTDRAETEEPKAEEPRVEETKVEETKAEESRAEEPRAEESRVEETRAEETRAEESRAEETRAEAPKTEGPKTEKAKRAKSRREKAKRRRAKARKTTSEGSKTEVSKIETVQEEEPNPEKPAAGRSEAEGPISTEATEIGRPDTDPPEIDNTGPEGSQTDKAET